MVINCSLCTKFLEQEQKDNSCIDSIKNERFLTSLRLPPPFLLTVGMISGIGEGGVGEGVAVLSVVVDKGGDKGELFNPDLILSKAFTSNFRFLSRLEEISKLLVFHLILEINLKFLPSFRRGCGLN